MRFALTASVGAGYSRALEQGAVQGSAEFQ